MHTGFDAYPLKNLKQGKSCQSFMLMAAKEWERPPSLGGLSIVGAPRFELGTSRTRTVRSTGLSHAPKLHFYL